MSSECVAASVLLLGAAIAASDRQFGPIPPQYQWMSCVKKMSSWLSLSSKSSWVSSEAISDVLDNSPEPWLTCGVRDPGLESAKRILLSRTRFPGLRSSLTTRVTLAQLLIQSGLDFVNNRSDLGINIILFLNDIFFSCLCFISPFNVVLVLALLCAPSTKGLLSDNLSPRA